MVNHHQQLAVCVYDPHPDELTAAHWGGRNAAGRGCPNVVVRDTMSGMQTGEVVIQSASEVPKSQFVRALNLAYADYYVPISLTQHSFDKLVTRESVRLDASVAAVEHKQVIGMGLLGVRGKRGWIGGVGVLPQHRHHGIGRSMMSFLIEQAKRLELKTLQLEVITANHVAYELYRSLGFKTIRKLLVLFRSGHGWMASGHSNQAGGFSIKRIATGAALDTLDGFITQPRPWQREKIALEFWGDELKGFGAWNLAGDLVGVMLYRAEPGQIGIMDIAGYAPDSTSALLNHLLHNSRGDHVSYVNVADDDPLIHALNRSDFTLTLDQYEMVLPLTSEASQ